MADIGVNRQWLVSPNSDIEDKWIDVQIQERVSRIVRHKQDIEDLLKSRKVDLEAKILMLEREILELKRKKDAVDINQEEVESNG